MSSINLKKVDAHSASIVQQLLDAVPSYYLCIDGVPNAGSAKAVFEELPPGCTHDDKHVLLIEENGTPIGVIDLIIGYPERSVAFIGLLLIDEARQGGGLGIASFHALENYLRRFDVNSIQLGVNDTNPLGMSFWKKLGFQPNGRSRINQGIKITSTVHVLEKLLHSIHE